MIQDKAMAAMVKASKKITWRSLWNGAVETLGGGVRYHRRYHVWLFDEGVNLPDYMENERKDGRIIFKEEQQ